MMVLVTYDVRTETKEGRRRLRRVAKACENRGQRVQKSVFECPNLTEEQFVKLRHRLEDCMDHTEDSIRFYPVCRRCLQGVEYSGIGDPPVKGDFSVV